MSNIGFAVDLPFTANRVPSLHALQAIRAAGFDFVLWHAGLDTNTEETSAVLKASGLKPIALSVPGTEFLSHAQQYLQLLEAFRVPDVVLQFDAATLMGAENILQKMDAIASSADFKNIRFLLGIQKSDEGDLCGAIVHCAEQSSSVCFMLDTLALAQDSEADIAGVVRSLPDRCPLLLLQDITDQAAAKVCTLGEGILDWDAIFDAAEEATVEWYVCRIQDTETDLELAHKNLEYLTERA